VTSLINKLFHKKSSQGTPETPQSQKPVNLSPTLDETGEGSVEKVSPDSPTTNQLGVAQLIVGVAYDVGIQRDHNEDSIFSLTANLISDKNLLNFGLYIVADGMGGHENGEVASSLAVSQLTNHVISSLYLPLISVSSNKMDLSVQEILQNGVMKAHHTIQKEAFGSGTTLTAALIIGDQLTIAHVGDSRAYSITPTES
jgi:protein phosphatase